MALKPLPAATRISIKFLRSRPGHGLVAILLSLLVMTSVLAQVPTTPRRVGILMSGLAADPATRKVLQALVDGLRERGWQEGRNIMLEARYAGPDPARFPELAAELVALKVDVITTANTQALDAARRNTTTLPIVMAGVTNPVKLGFVASFARPAATTIAAGINWKPSWENPSSYSRRSNRESSASVSSTAPIMLLRLRPLRHSRKRWRRVSDSSCCRSAYQS